MAYFPNGTSGMMYEEEYCCNCVHDSDEQGCPILALHYLYNYDQCRMGKTGKTVKAILGTLIPETKDGLGAEQCSMFLARADAEAEKAEQRRLAEQERKYREAMAELRALDLELPIKRERAA